MMEAVQYPISAFMIIVINHQSNRGLPYNSKSNFLVCNETFVIGRTELVTFGTYCYTWESSDLNHAILQWQCVWSNKKHVLMNMLMTPFSDNSLHINYNLITFIHKNPLPELYEIKKKNHTKVTIHEKAELSLYPNRYLVTYTSPWIGS